MKNPKWVDRLYEWSQRTSLIGTEDYPYAHDYDKSRIQTLYLLFLGALIPFTLIGLCILAIAKDIDEQSTFIWTCLPLLGLYSALTFNFYINLIRNLLAPNPIISIRREGVVFSCVSHRPIGWHDIVNVEMREIRHRGHGKRYILVETKKEADVLCGRAEYNIGKIKVYSITHLLGMAKEVSCLSLRHLDILSYSRRD